MKRRKFLQGLFATAVSAPVIAKAVISEPEIEVYSGLSGLKNPDKLFNTPLFDNNHVEADMRSIEHWDERAIEPGKSLTAELFDKVVETYSK